jgi:hypothetical protein
MDCGKSSLWQTPLKYLPSWQDFEFSNIIFIKHQFINYVVFHRWIQISICNIVPKFDIVLSVLSLNENQLGRNEQTIVFQFQFIEFNTVSMVSVGSSIYTSVLVASLIQTPQFFE